MKSLRTKVILSGIVLLFALVATIGSTYAWFTVSTQVSVSNFDLNVVTADSLLIRIEHNNDPAEDGTAYNSGSLGFSLDDFQSTITTADLLDNSTDGGTGNGLGTNYYQYASWQLTPVTAATGATSNATDYTGLQVYNDTTDAVTLSSIDVGTPSDRTLSVATADTSSGGYLAFNFWLLYTGSSATKTIVLQNLTFTDHSSPAIPALPQAASLGTIGDYSEATVTQNVFSAYADYGFTFYETDAGYSATAALNSVVTPGTLIDAVSTALGTVAVTRPAPGTITEYLVTATAANATPVCTLSQGVPEIVTVLVWLEGWDSQTTNGLSTGVLGVSFGFVFQS